MNLRSNAIQTGWGSQWETLADAITGYYGGSVESAQYQQVVRMLNSGEYTMAEMEEILGQIPEFTRTYNANGELIRVSYGAKTATSSSAVNVASEINSNVQKTVENQFSTVQTITKDSQTGKVTMSDTVTKYNSGTATSAKAIAGSAISAIAATSVGISVGKAFDSALYNFNPEFWDERGASSLNPETWAGITAGENDFGSSLFNFVFQIDENTGNPTPYLDENTFAYMMAYMIWQGVFDGETTEDTITQEEMIGLGWENTTDIKETAISSCSLAQDIYIYTYSVASGSDVHCCLAVDKDETIMSPYFASKTPFSITQATFDGSSTGYITLNSVETSALGETFYVQAGVTLLPSISSHHGNLNTIDELYASGTYTRNLGYIMLYGSSVPIGGVEGITDQPNARQFDASSITDPANISAVLLALQNQFPELWDNRIEISPNGDDIIKYIPVGFPTGGVNNQPTTLGATQSDLAPDISGDGDNVTDELIKTLIDMLQNPLTTNGMESDTNTPTKPIDPNGYGTGSGNTPAIITPTGTASALWAIYNPTQAQLDSFGGWLWSPNFVDQLLKLFNDPMQAIIGLHKIFATPPTSGNANIVVGYLDSGVSAKKVSSQYTEVDCGTVKLSEYFGNALDYTNTDVYLYLPFVGIVPLNVEDVTRANINVKYKVDVLTGACLASVNVARDANAGGQLYVYSGNCAVQYPLSSGSYMGIVSGILGVAGSVASTIMSGGAMLPMALGASAMAMNNAKSKVEHSGSLSGNSGAMGIKKPYLIIRRPQTKIAENFQIFNGESNNVYTVLSNCTGWTRAKYVHLENIPATDNELTEIEALLKSGVIISDGSVPNV